jgi:hypothetical protein
MLPDWTALDPGMLREIMAPPRPAARVHRFFHGTNSSSQPRITSFLPPPSLLLPLPMSLLYTSFLWALTGRRLRGAGLGLQPRASLRGGLRGGGWRAPCQKPHRRLARRPRQGLPGPPPRCRPPARAAGVARRSRAHVRWG